MTVIFVLWIMTSAWVEKQPYPTIGLCVQAAAGMAEVLSTPPRAVLAKFACVPTFVSGGGNEEPKLQM